MPENTGQGKVDKPRRRDDISGILPVTDISRFAGNALRTAPSVLRKSGCLPMRFAALIPRSGACSKIAVRLMFWPHARNPTLRFLEDDGLIQTDPAHLGGRPRRGHLVTPVPLVKARKVRGFMNGRGCRSVLARTTALNVGCCFEDAPVCRAIGPKIRHGGPDLRRDAVAGEEACAIPRRSLTISFMRPKARRLLKSLAPPVLRWTIEECFLRAKDDLGLDHCEARSWHGWHRHMTLVMAAAAFLAKLAADQRRHAFQQNGSTRFWRKKAA